MVKAGSKGPRSVLKSHVISRRATVLGQKQWALGDLRAVCLVWATGHCCHVPLSLLSLCSVLSLSRHAGCHCCAIARLCRAMLSHCVLWCCHTPLSSFSCPHASLSSVLHPLSPSCHTLHCCAPSLHCRAAVVLLDPPPSPSVIVTALSPSSRCRVSLLRCHWVPLSHRLHIAGPAAVAIMHWHALYLSHCTPLPSCCIHLHHCAIVCCHRHRVQCACFMRLASVLWRSAWAMGLSMGWWRGHCWGPLHVACMAVIVVVHCCCCRWFIVLHDQHHALVHDAWALQPGGGWLRGVALAPLDCGGGCVLWWTLVVAVHTVGVRI